MKKLIFLSFILANQAFAQSVIITFMLPKTLKLNGRLLQTLI